MSGCSDGSLYIWDPAGAAAAAEAGTPAAEAPYETATGAGEAAGGWWGAGWRDAREGQGGLLAEWAEHHADWVTCVALLSGGGGGAPRVVTGGADFDVRVRALPAA